MVLFFSSVTFCYALSPFFSVAVVEQLQKQGKEMTGAHTLSPGSSQESDIRCGVQILEVSHFGDCTSSLSAYSCSHNLSAEVLMHILVVVLPVGHCCSYTLVHISQLHTSQLWCFLIRDR